MFCFKHSGCYIHKNCSYYGEWKILKRAQKTGDKKLMMNATMNFAAGSCFASKVFCIPGMALEGTKAELNRAIKNKEITAEQANAVVQSTVGVIAGPVGKAINWVISKLPWNKIYEINDGTIENLEGKIPEYKMDFLSAMKDKELSRKDLKNSLKKLDFTDEEIDSVKEYANIPKGAIEGDELYKIDKNTIEKLKGPILEYKLDRISELLDKEMTEKEIMKCLKEVEFDREEIALVKAFAGQIEKDGHNTPYFEYTEDIGSMKKAASIAIGGGTGAMAGGFIGPYLGVLGGFAIGGPVGGVVGLIAGALMGFKAGSYLGGRAGNLVGTALERIFDGKKVELPEEDRALSNNTANKE